MSHTTIIEHPHHNKHASDNILLRSKCPAVYHSSMRVIISAIKRAVNHLSCRHNIIVHTLLTVWVCSRRWNWVWIWGYPCSGRPGPVFSYKLRYIVGFWLVGMAISTNQKPTIYRNLYENTGPGRACRSSQNKTTHVPNAQTLPQLTSWRFIATDTRIRALVSTPRQWQKHSVDFVVLRENGVT